MTAPYKWYNVYFLECGPYVKIGRSAPGKLSRRLRDLASILPEDSTLLGVIDCPEDHPTRSERFMHIRFAAYHHRGEWFRTNDVIREYVRRNGRSPLIGPKARKTPNRIYWAQQNQRETTTRRGLRALATG
jgi:hypothetical protein